MSTGVLFPLLVFAIWSGFLAMKAIGEPESAEARRDRVNGDTGGWDIDGGCESDGGGCDGD